MKVALHTQVRARRIEDYEQAHQDVPAELTDATRAADVTVRTIWRGGTDLFHVVDCASYSALLAELEDVPVTIAWQGQMAELLEVVHDYSKAGAGAGLPVVWQL